MKIISIVGARPQFIKLAPLTKEIRKHFNELIIHTGQHYDDKMSADFFKELDIPAADYNLGVGSGEHGLQTASMIKKISPLLIKESPDCVIVFGDTNSTFAGAIAAAKLNIPLIHIEAGLRSYNRTMPEEINRVVTDHISDYLFAPTEMAMQNLEKENLTNRAYLTGDIMADSLLGHLGRFKSIPLQLQYLELEPDQYYMLTLHRHYNVDNKEQLKNIISELSQLKAKIIFPVHPRTLHQIELNKVNPAQNIKLIEPLGHFDFIALLSNASKIITDSGGVQKEAYLLGKPCITLRTETEWMETVQAGWNILINPMESGFAGQIADFKPTKQLIPLFGQDVAKKMTAIICKHLE